MDNNERLIKFIFEYNKLVFQKENGSDKDFLKNKTNGELIYHLRNIIVHEFRNIQHVTNLFENVTCEVISKLFTEELSYNESNQIYSYIINSYKSYFEERSYTLNENSNRSGNYYFFTKNTAISGISRKIFVHKGSKFYSMNVSNYNAINNIYENVNNIIKNGNSFNIELNYEETELILSIMLHSENCNHVKYTANYRPNKWYNEAIFITSGVDLSGIENFEYVPNEVHDIRKEDREEDFHRLFNNFFKSETRMLINSMTSEAKELMKDFDNKRI